MSEVAHYSVIHGYAVAIKSPATIIDIGCGAGILRSYFREAEIGNYTGVDISSEAIRMCAERKFPSSQFIVADFDDYVPMLHDIVIFNESIGYARDPAATFRRYWGELPIGGACIISMHEYGMRSRASWRRIERCTKPVFTTRLVNEKHQVWDVKVFLKT
jgi:trans-aconitate methyltransferase